MIACGTVIALLFAATGRADQAPASITVDPHCTRAIRGISNVRREAYFGLCDPGTNFDARCRSAERYGYLVRECGVCFGRRLGVVKWLGRKTIREDPNRPGFVDLGHLEAGLCRGRRLPGEAFRRDMGGRLDVAAHGHHNAFPTFMGKYLTAQAARDPKKRDWVPRNIGAAGELSAAVLKHAYTDFDRPAYYEPVNEPHWSYPADGHFQRWHLKTLGAVRKVAPRVRVGGPCLSVAYFYGRQYRNFAGLRAFIDGTKCGMDFYSFHAYDYLRDEGGDFGGRITSGLPLEGVLDLVSNYTHNAYGKEVALVLSEHGGYGADDLVEALAKKHFPGEGFEWEMKKRSIDDLNMVRSVLANTLVFMDHPHVVRKAVPFILLEAMAWNPKYYAVLYVPHNYTDRQRWVPTKKILFYRFFRDLRGRRVKASCSDPDLQVRAFVDGRTLRVVVNNLHTEPQTVSLDMPTPARVTLRRLGRNQDFTPYMLQSEAKSLRTLRLAAREAVLIEAEYARQIEQRLVVDEIPCYGDRIAAEVDGEARFTVRVPDAHRLAYATLRVGIARPAGTGKEAAIALNGKPAHAPAEECADRFEDARQGYATCRIIPLAPREVRARNTVTVSFPDGKPGSVGSVVIRAGRRAGQ